MLAAEIDDRTERRRTRSINDVKFTRLKGLSGTGKSHLLIGLGLAACERCRPVRYVTTAQLVIELVGAADERVLSGASVAVA